MATALWLALAMTLFLPAQVRIIFLVALVSIRLVLALAMTSLMPVKVPVISLVMKVMMLLVGTILPAVTSSLTVVPARIF